MKITQENQDWNVPLLTEEVKSVQTKRNRTHGGSNLMPVIEELLSSSDNWYEVVSINDYQYPGVFADEGEHDGEQYNPPRMGHVSNLHELPHFTGQNHHLLYNENQLCKGHYNDNIRQVNIDGQT